MYMGSIMKSMVCYLQLSSGFVPSTRGARSAEIRTVPELTSDYHFYPSTYSAKVS